MFTSQMPSSRAEMFRVGYSWTSRACDAAQNLVDIATYKQEKLGSRPQRAILTTRGGLDPETVQDAFEAAESAMSGYNLTRYSKFVVVGDPTMPEAGLDMLDLASLPDGFDEKTATDLGMYVIALTGAVPPRWLWPATTTGATKADAMYQHVAGLTGGPGATLNLIATMLGGSKEGPRHVAGKFLPPQLKLIFDFQDDEQDRQQADIRDTRSQQRERDINSNVMTVQVARQQALAAGDIEDDQYETMELEDGRTPEGTEVINLFYSGDPDLIALLDVGVDDPLLILANDPVEVLANIEDAMLTVRDVLINASQGKEQRRANQALAALNQLKGLYLEEAVGSEEEEAPPEEESESEEEEPERETETETPPEPESAV